MQKPRHHAPRRGRKQLQAELDRLSVPTRAKPAPARPTPRDTPAAADPEQPDERIRRMIEAAYT